MPSKVRRAVNVGRSGRSNVDAIHTGVVRRRLVSSFLGLTACCCQALAVRGLGSCDGTLVVRLGMGPARKHTCRCGHGTMETLTGLTPGVTFDRNVSCN